MYIQVSLKSIGKKQQSVQSIPYKIQCRPSTVRELILAVTEAEVLTYNRHIDTPQLLAHLTRTKEEIEDQAQAGKVSFGANYNGKKADLRQAQENAVQCFEDGIYRIFQMFIGFSYFLELFRIGFRRMQADHFEIGFLNVRL